MDADEKLTALKKAYAEIILNISKEAAARVMESEKKAARYQHELKVAKEEALRMLVRLKQMMDSKSIVAEAASLNQQKKIEEVEAQLQEAEDIVKDLREELREVQSELDRVKSENFQPANELDNFRPKEVPVENGNYSHQSSALLPSISREEFSVASTQYQSLRNDCHKCYNRVACMCGWYNGNIDLPSIILRGKAPGLYRNGCTQRIRACERNQLFFSDKVKEKKSEVGLKDDNGSGFGSCIQKKRRTIRRGKPVAPMTEKPMLSELSARNDSILVKGGAYFCYNKLENSEFSEKEENLVEIDVENMQNYEDLIENVVPINVETGNAESFLSLNHKKDAENIHTVVSNPGTNISDATRGICCQPVSERDFKYTFQRKRKREALTSSLDVSLAREKKSGEEANGDQNLDPSGSSFSSRNQRRLAQVARQDS